MAFSPDLVINLETYSLVSQNGKTSVRSDATQPVEAPHLVTVSHETLSDGRVSSVVYFDFGYVPPVGTGCTSTTTKNDRFMVKLQYNPTDGDTAHAARLESQRVALIDFLSGANLTKLLNRES